MARIKYYFDEMMPRDVARGLISSGIDVIMAVDADMTEKDDVGEHLAFATRNQAVTVTLDKPFATCALAVEAHAGVICWTGGQRDFGGMVRSLAKFADEFTAEQAANMVFWRK